MASSQQSTGIDKSNDASALSHSASQNSLLEACPPSHVHDVRVPEVVYNIDEETRMGPEMTNDGITTPSTHTAVKNQAGKVVEAKTGVSKPESSAPTPVKTSFSALSFIASQYAESENSSPRSSDSPPGMEESCPMPAADREETNHSSDGFDTSSLSAPSLPSHQKSQVVTDEGKVHFELGASASGDAPVLIPTPDHPELVSVELPEKDVGVNKDAVENTETEGHRDLDMNAESRDQGPEVNRDMMVRSDVVMTDITDVSKDKAASEDAEMVSKTTALNPEADMPADVVPDVDDNGDEVCNVLGEEEAVIGIETECVSKLTEEEEVAEKVIQNSKDEGSKDAGEDVGKDITAEFSAVLSDGMGKDGAEATHDNVGEEAIKDETAEVMKVESEVLSKDADKEISEVVGEEAMKDITEVENNSSEVTQKLPDPASPSIRPESLGVSTPPEAMDTVEPMETEDVRVEKKEEEKVETEENVEMEEKMETEDTDVLVLKEMVDTAVNDAPEDPKLALNSDFVMSEDPKLALNTDSVMSEDSKLVSNLDSNMSEDMKLVSNMDSMMSEDSKLVCNLDSVLSSGFEEGEDQCVVKGPSVVVPFGENANSSMPLMGLKALEGENSNISFVDESSQSNSMAEKPTKPKRPRRSSITDIQDSMTNLSKNENEDGLQAFPAERLFEYQWPQDGGEWYLLQEQVSEYLGVLSFKRKHPDLTRRTCDKLEKEFLREKGVVTETQSDLGLTAIRSEELYDLMMKDYPDKYHEYATLLHEREKQKISDKHKEYEVAQPKLEKSKMADYIKKAARSAAEYNRHLHRERKEERLAFFDLQTFMIQYPERRYKKLAPEATKPSAYPVALIPGQFQDHYCSYTSDELRYFPLNTALYDPPKKMPNTLAKPAGSGESSDDSSEDKSGSSSDSSGSNSGSSDSETLANVAAKANSNVATTTTPVTTTPLAATPTTPLEPPSLPIRKLGKKVAKVPTRTPAKTPARGPGKGKRKLDAVSEVRVAPTMAATGVQTGSGPSSPAPKKEKMEEEEEDKDKCRICSTAVLFLKYKRVETKMIKCSECGKIAHPSCLDLTDKMVQVITTYPWQCMECKTCVECMDPYDEDKMLFCDRCDRGYHTFCVGLRCLPSGRWECRSCKGVAEVTKSRRGRPIKPT